MLILCVTFALLTVGFVVPCVIDVATTPRYLFDFPSKRMWLMVVIGFWAFGAAVWLLIGRRETRMRMLWDGMTESWALNGGRPLSHDGGWTAGADYPFASSRRGHQAAVAPARFVAPDDNPDFLLELDRRIRDWGQDI
jgi:hypothetical protein